MVRVPELRVKARELLRQPGLQRRIVTAIAPSVLDLDADHLAGDIDIDLTAVSTTDHAIVVHGTIGVPWASACRRCLVPLSGTDRVAVDEVYRDDPGDGDVFPIEGDQIDLAPAVRDHVALDAGDDRLCRDDCAGICPVCGADRNTIDCGCVTTVGDDRWAALDQLRLDD